MLPPPLAPGARIGVFAPSGVHDPERLERSMALVRSWGWEPVPGPNLGARHRYFAGDDDQRLADLLWALSDPSLDAAWMSRGGSGLTRLLDRIPWDRLESRPVIGFSDGTALMAGLHQTRGLSGIHGPVLHSLADHADPASREHLRRLLAGERVASLEGRAVVAGSATGPLIGGNLCLLAALCGTPQQVSARGAILIVEDVAEPAYRVDRMLQQLRAAGCLDGVAGVARGRFLNAQEPEDGSWSLDDVFAEHLPGVPTVADLPVGHGPENRAFFYGAPATLAAGHLSWDLNGGLS